MTEDKNFPRLLDRFRSVCLLQQANYEHISSISCDIYALAYSFFVTPLNFVFTLLIIINLSLIFFSHPKEYNSKSTRFVET